MNRRPIRGYARRSATMLTAKKVERTKTPGRYRDGLVPGLLLQVSDSGARSWVLRYMLHGRERMLGLGPVTAFNLKEARDRAAVREREDSIAGRALEFLILTASRSGEVLG